MGKRLLSKLGNFLRVFKGGKKKAEKGKLDSTNSTSESLIKASDNSSTQCFKLVRDLRLRKSKSTTESLNVSPNTLTNEFNELKRSLGTCDIFGADKKDDVKCTKSLNRLSYLGNANNTILSYNAKLHNSKIWSQALGRSIAKPAIKNESLTSSVTQNESEFNLDPEVSFAAPYGRWNSQCHSADEIEDLSVKNIDNTRTFSSDNESSSKKYDLRRNFMGHRFPRITDDVESEIGSGAPFSFKAKVNSSELAREECYEIACKKNVELETDMKSKGDGGSAPNCILAQKSNTAFESEATPKIQSGETTEYEVVNMAQVDLFKEFKTTIAKMRKVLNVLEVKKSFHRITGRCLSDKMLNQGSSVITNGHRSTQTTGMNRNLSDPGFPGHTKTEGVMAQLSTEVLRKRRKTKNIVLNSALFKYMKPLRKAKRRKKCRRFHQNRYDKAKIGSSNTSSKGHDKKLRTSMKPDKPQYSRCIVYHITQKKNAVDRCVGTRVGLTKKNNVIVHKTFSALHFGPIRDFPMLLDKHENEENKKRELGVKLKSTSISDTKKRESTAVLQTIRERSCHICKTQPSLSTTEPPAHSESTSTNSKWLVIEPKEPLVAKVEESTPNESDSMNTNDLLSNLIDEDFKNTGLRGTVSNNTMSLLKDKFGDKLSSVSSQDVPPDVMITLCVPLKDLVSKMKTKKGRTENKYDANCCDLGVQVSMSKSYVNDNLQTIPEKMCKKPEEIYQHHKHLRDSTSCRRLATFKKIFGNKSTSCSSISACLTPSKLFSSEQHSTSSPEFLANRTMMNPVFPIDKTSSSTDQRSSSMLSSSMHPRDACGSRGKPRSDGFYLNLPLNRCRKKRAQISRLFGEIGSSESRYPEVLYNVHDSSFLSSTQTDDNMQTSIDCQLKTSSSHEKLNVTSPFTSEANAQVTSKFISFSDLPKRTETESQNKNGCDQILTNDYKYRKILSAKKFEMRNVDVNTSNEKLYQDSCTQWEYFLKESESSCKEVEEKKVMVEAGTYFNNCIEDFSMQGSSKVVVVAENVEQQEESMNNHSSEKSVKQLHEELESKNKTSQLSLFAHNETDPKTETDSTKTHNDIGDQEKPKVRKHKRKISETTLRTSSGSNILPDTQREIKHKSERHSKKKHKPRKSQETLKNYSTQDESNHDMSTKEPTVEPSQVRTKHENNLTSLIRDIVDMCNTSFVKSRDCIVELTLYNLIKEIITEHCSNLTEHSKKKVESILSNFVKDSKCRACSRDVEIVESAIAELVKEADSNSKLKDKSETEKEEAEEQRESRNKHRYACDTDGDKTTDNDHRDRSKSRHSRHRHGSKHRSRRRDSDKYRRKDRSKSRSKGHHRHHHHHHDNGKKCDHGNKYSQLKFRESDGRKQYQNLVQRLKDLESATQQLSMVANDHREPDNDVAWHSEHKYAPHICHRVYTATIDDHSGKSLAKRRMKFSMSEVQQSIESSHTNTTYIQNKTTKTFLPVVQTSPKLPVTKIVINLSNLRLLTDNCASIMSTSVQEPVVITDSTEEKQELINKIIRYESEDLNRDKSKFDKRNTNRSSVINKNKESFTITIHEGGEKSHSQVQDDNNSKPKRNKDVMRIKMVRKKKTVTSTSEQSSVDTRPVLKPQNKPATFSDIHNITKEYIKREYKLKSDDLCSNIARDLLENNCKIDQILGHKGNLDLAYQRMANFCMFRGLLRKNSENNL